MTEQYRFPRYPAVPLVVHDPYFSLWSFADKLTDNWSSHWTGAIQSLCGMLRIDGVAWRFAGIWGDLQPMEQIGLEVWPTRTVYRFAAAGVELTLTFLTPALLHKLEILSRPVSYVEFRIRSLDGKAHDVALYFDAGGELCLDNVYQAATWGRLRLEGLEVMTVAAAEQRPLHRAGDDHRIDWGRFYLAVPQQYRPMTAIRSNFELRGCFVAGAALPDSDDFQPQRMQFDGWVSPGMAVELGTVEREPAEVMLMLAYDDVWSVEYLGRKLAAYWRRNGRDFGEMLRQAWREYPALRQECAAYDREWMNDCRQSGGEAYAHLCALAFRQAIGAHKLVADEQDRPLFFSKENFSNGCIATVDITYPSAPLFLLAQPTLLKGMLLPILDYAETRRWKFPFAPHDLGTYPLANGQVYGGGERDELDQMPVEECGNLLLLAAALVKFADELEFARRYYPTLKQWADYLNEKGYDPENQLCTDDFAGHLAHNTNLSLKAILALAAFAQLAGRLGEDAAAVAVYRQSAETFAAHWRRDAWAGDHYKLAFDREDSWSQKYNLVWDRLLELELFPAEVAETELAWYRVRQERYGLPLDNRKSYTKLDWIIWSATLTGRDEDFQALLQPVARWLAETPSRVPLTDWYDTLDGRQVGFQARSVVGGVFIKLLADAAMRLKWRAGLAE